MATRQQRRKRMREQVDELMKNFHSRPEHQTKQTYVLEKPKRIDSTKPKKSYFSEKIERVISSQVVLDTNVIIDSWNNNYLKQIQQLLKKNDLRIILSETTLGESIRKLQTDKNTLMRSLENSFGNRFEIHPTMPEMVEDARKMEEKYDSLHNPDSIILAVAKKFGAAIISNDDALTECCKEEEIEVYDHRRQKLEPTRYQRLQEQKEREKATRELK